MLARILALSLLVITSGCATSHQIADTRGLKSVAIVVAFPEQLHLHYQGILSVVREDVPVDWEINRRMTDRLISILESRYTIHPLSYDPIKILGTMTYEEVSVGTDSATESRLKELFQPGIADAIIVAQALMGTPTQGASMTQIRGYHAVGMGYRLTVFDGATFKPLAASFGSLPPPPGTIVAYGRASLRIYFGWQGESFRSLPTSTQEQVRQIIEDVINQSALVTLQRVGLIDR